MTVTQLESWSGGGLTMKRVTFSIPFSRGDVAKAGPISRGLFGFSKLKTASGFGIDTGSEVIPLLASVGVNGDFLYLTLISETRPDLEIPVTVHGVVVGV